MVSNKANKPLTPAVLHILLALAKLVLDLRFDLARLLLKMQSLLET